MRRYICLLLCLSILGCSSVATVKGPLAAPALQSENLPLREINVVVLTPDPGKMPAIKELVRRSSDALSAQVGITLRIIDWKPIQWRSGDRAEVLKEVVLATDHYDKPYDIVLAFHDFGFPEFVRYALIGGWEGVIDDTYRRFIVVRRMTVQVLLHELCHGFLFTENHTWGLRHLMQPVTFYIVPGIIPLNRSVYLKERDRKEILKNKWRDFSRPPALARSEIEDPVALSYADVRLPAGSQ
jgi:hypothetical protein